MANGADSQNESNGRLTPEKSIAEKLNTSFTEDQKSAITKALFVPWLLNYAKNHPDLFPEKPGFVVHEAIGDSPNRIPALSVDEILVWHNKNRPDNLMSFDEANAILIIQKKNGLTIIDSNYYSLSF